MDDYLGKVQATVWAASGWVSNDGLEGVQRLVDHGEPAEAMCELAWVIVNEETAVPSSLIRDIRRFSEELVNAEFMLPDLDAYGIPETMSGRCPFDQPAWADPEIVGTCVRPEGRSSAWAEDRHGARRRHRVVDGRRVDTAGEVPAPV